MPSVLSEKVRKKITNVIVTAELGQRVDATKFNQYPWGRYDLELYGGRCGYVKDETIEGSVTVFLSGKMISVGARSVRSAKRQLTKAMELMVHTQLVKRVKLKSKVQNIVALIDLNRSLDVNYLSTTIPKAIYEPEQFPGLIHRTSIGPTLLIFSSGKIVVAGARSEKEIEQVSSMITETL